MVWICHSLFNQSLNERLFSRVFAIFSYYQKSCYVSSCTDFCVNLSFHFSRASTQEGTDASCTKCVCLVAQSHLTLCDPMDCSPGSSVHGIILTRILEWVAISSSRGSSQPRGRTHVSCISCIGKQIPYH